MLVMKFKGAVLQNQETLAEIKNRIKEQNCCSIVVVSALKGVMPRLRQLYGLSLRRGTGFENEFNELKQVHEQLKTERLNDLYGILHHVGVLRESSHCMKDYILAKGDILASLLFSKLFDQAEWHDSRNFMLTDGNFGAPEVLWEESCRAARQEFRGLRGMAVVPGYCGKTEAGYTISMGRVGLSLTAAVLEAAFQQVKVA